MNIPKWLLPVIGVIAAVAVGIAAVLIGMRFTSPVVPVLSTEEAPILGPSDPPADDSPYVATVPVGTTGIVTPGQTGLDPVDAGAQAAIDGLNGGHGYPATGRADEPADAPAPPAEGGDDAPLDLDDPCATADPPDGCPVGVTGIVLADTRIPAETDLRVDVDPATTGGGLTCAHDPAPAGAIWVGIGTTVPMTDLTLTYAPANNPSSVQTAHSQTSATDLGAWNRDYAAHHVYREHYWFFVHCVQLTGLTAGEYSLTVDGTDLFARSPRTVTTTFDSRGDVREPPVSAVPLNSALLYVSVPSPSGVDARRPFIRAWVMESGDTPDCSAFDSQPDLPTLMPQTAYPVDAAWLTSQHYDPTYLSRDVVVYSVPEGAQLMVCARWYSTPTHSWESSVSRQRSLVVSSPDTVTPTIGIESIALGRQVPAGALTVSVSMPGGVACGPAWTGPDAARNPGSFDVGVGLCDAATRGFDGRVVVTTSIDLGDGHRIDHSQVLQLERRHCTGTCAIPADSHYQVDLPTVRVGTGLCSGDGCTPPSTETSLGRLNLVVQWAQGRSNGLRGWAVGAVNDDAPGAAESGSPQFDTNVVPTTGHVNDGHTGTISMPVVLDRPGHYRAHLSGDCMPDGATRVLTGEVLQAQVGGTSPPPTITFNGLCASGTYSITLAVWDDSTHQNIYAFDSSGPTRWPHALVPLLAVPVHVTTTITVSAANRDHNSFGINQVGYALGDEGMVNYGTDPHCQLSTDHRGIVSTFTETVGQADEYTVTVHFPVYTANPAFPATGGPDQYCGFQHQDYRMAAVTGTVTLDQLLGGVTLTGHPVYDDSSTGLGNFSDLTSYIDLQGTRG